MIKFYSTKGEYGFLSNFYPCRIYDGERVWASSERLYQASKTYDIKYIELINNAKTNFDAIKIGRSIDLPIKKDWEEIKVKTMYEILLLKFQQNVQLKNKLIKTGSNKILEDSPTDYFWGIGKDGNILGKLLMIVREDMKTLDNI